jgi:DNA-directed RNA polymerase specialized sigma24 family protein
MAELKRDWTLNQGAFGRLLEWLDEGEDSKGERYLEVRRRLRLYFDRKNCLSPDDLTDETLNRIARKLEEKGSITDVSALHYCYIVAKYVFLENLRRLKAEHIGAAEDVRQDTAQGQSVKTESDHEAREKMHGCLEKCLDELPNDDRELILEYYRSEGREKIERRSELAGRLGLSKNALILRASRIRTRLEGCVRSCCGEG